MGIDENIEATLTYLFGFLSGLIFLLIERKNYFVKFHALQSFLTFLGLWILSFFLTYLPYVGVLLIFLLNGISILFWLLGMYKAYQGEAYRFPMVGSFAERQLYRI